jgi:hypothetical protein
MENSGETKMEGNKSWSTGMLMYQQVYPIVFFFLTGAAVVRFILFLLHVYNPYVEFLPPYSRITEFFICLLYTLPAIGWWYFKKWFLLKKNFKSEWEEKNDKDDHPAITIHERWGGEKKSDVIIFAGSISFLLLTLFFILTAI